MPKYYKMSLTSDALALVSKRQKANEGLSEQETIQLHALEKSLDVLKDLGSLDEKTLAGKLTRVKAEERLTQEIVNHLKEERRLKDIVEEQINASEQLIIEKQSQKDAAEAERKQSKAAAEAEKARAKAAAEMRAAALKEQAEQKRMLAEVDKIQTDINKKFMNEGEIIAQNYDAQIERLREISYMSFNMSKS
jgi:hypothetical protein